MRLINTLFIICLFGKLINCNNNNDQNKSNDNLVQSASNQQQTTQTGPESRQISGPMNHGGYHDSNSNNINIYANELSPKQSAYHNSHPGAPIGYIKIQPLLASPFASSHHQPEEQGSTTFLNFIKPEKHSRRSLLTNKLKSYISSLLSWKDSTNSNTPYMTSGSSYSYSALHPPFNFQPSPQHQSSASSQYKSIVFPNYQPNSNGYKFSNTFNPTHLNGNNQQPNNQHSPQSQYYNNQPSASSQLNSYALNSNSLNNLNNPSQTFTTYQNRNQNNLNSNSNLNNNNYNFPPNSFQVASSSNVNSVYTSTSNQYQPSSNQNNQQELNNNQRSETVDSLNDSSSSLNNPGNSSNNPVSNSLKNKQQFNTY